jgi:hypothetical protein
VLEIGKLISFFLYRVRYLRAKTAFLRDGDQSYLVEKDLQHLFSACSMQDVVMLSNVMYVSV